jgi:hypothetical protein
MGYGDRGMGAGSDGAGVGIRQAIVVVGLVFAITLAVVVGKKMSAEAMAVVVGIVCGVAAAIPTSLLLLVVFTRKDRQMQDEMEARSRSRQYDSPPVVVIQGGAPQALPGPQAGYWPAADPGPAVNRQFHVVGGEDLMADDGRY